MSQIHQLVHLQELDSALEDSKKQLIEILNGQKDPPELIAARQRAEAAQTDLQKQAILQKDQELELGSISSKKQNAEARLYSGKVKNPKELADLEQSVQALGRKKDELEEQFLETMMLHEEAVEEQAAAAQTLVELEKAHQNNVAQLKDQQLEVAMRTNQLTSQRQTQAGKLDPRNLADYERLRKRRGGVVVNKLKVDMCEGCRTTVSAAVMRQVERREVAHCPHCDRILYAVNL